MSQAFMDRSIWEWNLLHSETILFALKIKTTTTTITTTTTQVELKAMPVMRVNAYKARIVVIVYPGTGKSTF